MNHGLYSRSVNLEWKQFRELYFAEYCHGLRKTSRDNIASVFDVIEQEMNPKSLSFVDERFISVLVSKLRQRELPLLEAKRKAGQRPRVGLEPVTIRNYMVALKTALKWAADQGFIHKCPRFPKIKVVKRKPQAIPKDTFERLIEAEEDPRWQVFMCCGWWAGLRLSEVFAMRWERSEKFPWIDWTNDRIVLPAEFAKSNEGQWVPLHQELRRLLETLDRAEDKVFPFTNRHTGQPLTRSGVTNHVLTTAKRAGVKLSMHRLRKGFGCRRHPCSVSR